MRNPSTPQMVALLARSAGFEFTSQRCELLSPQLDWLLEQGDVLAEMKLEAEEPPVIFRPQAAVSLVGKEVEHG